MSLSSASPDRIDAVAGIAAGSPLDVLRRRRDKVRDGTQGSDAVLFDAALPADERQRRLLLALHGVTVAAAPALAADYRARTLQAGADPALVAQIAGGEPAVLASPALRAMLDYTATLLLRPLEGDRAALQALEQAGLATGDIVLLSQLAAFLSFQVRLLAGLRALSAAGVAA